MIKSQLEGFKKAGEGKSMAAMLLSLADVYTSMGNDEGLKPAKEALVLFKDLKEAQLEAECMLTIVKCYINQDDSAEALGASRKAVTMMENIGNKDGEAVAHEVSALAFRAAKKDDESLKSAKTALTLYQDLGDKKGEGNMLTAIAEVQLIKGRPAEAKRVLLEAIALFKEMGYGKGEVTATNALVEVMIAQDETLEALRMIKTKLGEFQANIAAAVEKQDASKAKKMILLQACLSHVAITAYLATGDFAGAMHVANEVRPLFEQLGDKSAEANTVARMAEIFAAAGQLQDAADMAVEAMNMLKKIGNKKDMDGVAGLLTLVYTEMGMPQKSPNRPKALELLRKLCKAADDRDAPLFGDLMQQLKDMGGTTEADFESAFSEMVAQDPALLDFLEEQEDVGYQTDEPINRKSNFLDRQLVYYVFKIIGMGYGPRFRVLKQCWQRGPLENGGTYGKSYANCILGAYHRAGSWENAMQYIHPGQADAALQSGMVYGYADKPQFGNKIQKEHVWSTEHVGPLGVGQFVCDVE